MKAQIENIFTEKPEVYIFRNERDKEEVIIKLSKSFDVIGTTIINRQNGQEIDAADFESIVYHASSQYLKALGRGKYIPKFVDKRSSEERSAHKKDVEDLIERYFDKSGFVFRGEHLGDSTLRSLAKSRIAEHFLFEAGNEEGEVVLRKYTNGMFSPKQFTIDEVVNHYATSGLDHKRTNRRQDEIRSEIRSKETILKGGEVKKERIEELFNEQKKAYTRKVLPSQSMGELEEEFSRRALFRMGVPNREKATLHQIKIIDGYKSEKMQQLDKLPDNGEIQSYKTQFQSWNIDSNNTNGYHLPAEMI